MIDRWEACLFRLRKRFSRSEWTARLLGVPVHEESGTEPGLMLVQIDGFSRAQLEAALERNRMPFLKSLLAGEHYRLHTMYSGLPSTTPAVQAELFYGVKTAVAAFGFLDRSTDEVVEMLDPEIAAEKERWLAAHGAEPLLEGGSVYTDNLSGGAAEPHFSIAALTWRQVARRIRPWLWPVILALYAPSVLQVACRSVVELLVAVLEAVGGVLRGDRPWDEFKFVPRRILAHVILREWATMSAQIDAVRGLPVIHLNFVNYDEMAHRRGPGSAFAHRSLRETDRCIRRLWRAALESDRREYDVWIYADHGQESVTPYPTKYGRSIEHAVAGLFDGGAADAGRTARPPRVRVAAVGPVGYLYPDRQLDDEECERLAARLMHEADVPTVLFVAASGVQFRTRSGRRGALPDEAAELFSADHPFLADLPTDMIALCRHPDAGRLVICGWSPDEPPLSFPPEHGVHAGPGPQETGAFAILPQDAPVPGDAAYLRPLHLRAAALRRLGRAAGPWSAACGGASCAREGLRVVTYNVHSCVGMDGKLSPRRIARVIAQCDPDIVALQELDVRRRRTGGRDQAEEIARHLNMTFHFHPAMRLQEEQYGDAILSRLPMRLVHAGPLPGHSDTPWREPRGAIWVEVTLGGRTLQVFNTHLGLFAEERLRQVEALLGPEWLGHPRCAGPVIFCSDLNATPRSQPYRLVAERLRDAQREANGRRARGTFFSRWPLVRIDHVFLKGPIEAAGAEVVRTVLARQASDHLPLAVELRVFAASEELRSMAPERADVEAAPSSRG